VRIFGFLAVALLLAAPARAESLAAPRIEVNDSWVYQNTVEDKTGWHQTRVETAVERVGPTTIALSSKQAGSTMPPVEVLTGADWSRTRSVNGHETVVNRPLSFPLSVGKTWTVEYAEDHPNRQHSNEHLKQPYKVTGWEDVTVPAGTFHALKIEGDGDWTATAAPAVSAMAGSRVDAQGPTTLVQTNRVIPGTSSGRTYKAFWYVPSVKKWVKAVEEYYSSNGIRSWRITSELVSFQNGN
jgi:hypothetical protein